MKKYYVIFVFLLLAFNSCKENNVSQYNDPEFIVFGHFFGECMGEECIEIFKLEEGVLYEDTNDNYPTSQDFYQADYIKLENIDISQLSDILDNIPSKLLDKGSGVIGQPDAGDWGGIYFEYKDESIHKFWLIDLNQENLEDEYLKDFVVLISEKIDIINK